MLRCDPRTATTNDLIAAIKVVQHRDGLSKHPGQAAIIAFELPARLALRLAAETSLTATIKAIQIFFEIESMLESNNERK